MSTSPGDEFSNFEMHSNTYSFASPENPAMKLLASKKKNRSFTFQWFSCIGIVHILQHSEKKLCFKIELKPSFLNLEILVAWYSESVLGRRCERTMRQLRKWDWLTLSYFVWLHFALDAFGRPANRLIGLNCLIFIEVLDKMRQTHQVIVRTKYFFIFKIIWKKACEHLLWTSNPNSLNLTKLRS